MDKNNKVKQLLEAKGKQEAEAVTSAQDRNLGIKFEATKILLPYLTIKENDTKSLAKHVNEFLKGIGYE